MIHILTHAQSESKLGCPVAELCLTSKSSNCTKQIIPLYEHPQTKEDNIKVFNKNNTPYKLLHDKYDPFSMHSSKELGSLIEQ